MFGWRISRQLFRPVWVIVSIVPVEIRTHDNTAVKTAMNPHWETLRQYLGIAKTNGCCNTHQMNAQIDRLNKHFIYVCKSHNSCVIITCTYWYSGCEGQHLMVIRNDQRLLPCLSPKTFFSFKHTPALCSIILRRWRGGGYLNQFKFPKIITDPATLLDVVRRLRSYKKENDGTRRQGGWTIQGEAVDVARFALQEGVTYLLLSRLARQRTLAFCACLFARLLTRVNFQLGCQMILDGI